MSELSEPGNTRRHKLKVLIADGSAVACRRLREELEHLPFVEIAGEAHTCHKALELFLRERPEVVLVSISLPEHGGFEVLRSIKQTVDHCVVVLTTLRPDPFVENTAILLGATDTCAASEGFVQLKGLLKRHWNGKLAGERDPQASA